MQRSRINLEAISLQRYALEIGYWFFMLLWTLLAFVSFRTGHATWRDLFGFFFILQAYAGFIEPHILTKKCYPIDLVKEPTKTIRLIFLSDLHTGSYKRLRYFRRLAKRVASLHPDILVFGGDLVEERSESIASVRPFEEVRPRFGKYFILGNHDYVDDPLVLSGMLESFGFNDLTNMVIPVQDGDASFSLIGIDDTWFGAPSLDVLKHAPRPRVLMSHEPDVLLDLEENDADVVVAGHTHGGQVRIPIMGPVLTLPQGAPQRFDQGKKFWKNIPVIVSRGIGEDSSRVRFCSPPQIVILDLKV